jgi:hypothetical protein
MRARCAESCCTALRFAICKGNVMATILETKNLTKYFRHQWTFRRIRR